MDLPKIIIQHHEEVELERFTEDDLIQLSLLRSLEIDELVETSLIDPAARFDEILLDEIQFLAPEIRVDIKTGARYPAVQLTIEYDNSTLPRLVMDDLRIRCRQIIADGEKQNNLTSWRQCELDTVFECHMTVLEVMKAIDEHIRNYRLKIRDAAAAAYSKSDPEIKTLSTNLGRLKNDGISMKGVDVSSLSFDTKASTILNKLPEDICAMIPECFRILHIESVLRNDLHANFLYRQDQMFKHLSSLPAHQLKKCVPPKQLEGHGRDTSVSMARYLTTPKITFHGTSTKYVPSIIRHGFLAPGMKHPETHQPLPVRCGSTYGQGIYSSPSAEFSLSYSGTEAQPTTTTGFWGLKLFVCATIMGRSAQMTRDDEWWLETKPHEGADSHVGNNSLEYIVFDSAQILPCYIIHLDWGNDNIKYFQDVDANRANFVSAVARPHLRLLKGDDVAPGDKQRMKEALVAKAAKYFPYGYGPASGTRFVVEEVGEVDEDEEEYGDYQNMRVDSNHEAGDFWGWDKEDDDVADIKAPVSALDEYTRYVSGKQSSGLKNF